MAGLIDRGDPNDPIARQFVPDARELQQRPEERADPLGEARAVAGAGPRAPLSRPRAAEAHARVPGLLPLLLPPRGGGPGRPAGAVGRARSMPRSATSPATPGIWEVILTGGDPFMLSPRRIAEVTSRLGAIAARQGAALAHARAGGGPGARHARPGLPR